MGQQNLQHHSNDLKSMLDQILVGNRLSVLKTKGGFYSPIHFAAKCGYIDKMSVMMNTLPEDDTRLDVLTQYSSARSSGVE